MKKLMRSKMLSAILSITLVLTLLNGVPAFADGTVNRGIVDKVLSAFDAEESTVEGEEGREIAMLGDSEKAAIDKKNEEGRLLAAAGTWQGVNNAFDLKPPVGVSQEPVVISPSSSTLFGIAATVTKPDSIPENNKFKVYYEFEMPAYTVSGAEIQPDSYGWLSVEKGYPKKLPTMINGKASEKWVLRGYVEKLNDETYSQTIGVLNNSGGHKDKFTFSGKMWTEEMNEEQAKRDSIEFVVEGPMVLESPYKTYYDLSHFTNFQGKDNFFKTFGWYNKIQQKVYLTKEEKDAAVNAREIGAADAKYGGFYTFVSVVYYPTLTYYSFPNGVVPLSRTKAQKWQLDYNVTVGGGQKDTTYAPVHIDSAFLRDLKNSQNGKMYIIDSDGTETGYFKDLGVERIVQGQSHYDNVVLALSGKSDRFMDSGLKVTDDPDAGKLYFEVKETENLEAVLKEPKRNYMIAVNSLFFIPLKEDEEPTVERKFNINLNNLELYGAAGVEGQEPTYTAEQEMQDDKAGKRTNQYSIPVEKSDPNFDIKKVQIGQRVLTEDRFAFRPRIMAPGAEFEIKAVLDVDKYKEAKKIHANQLLKFDADYFELNDKRLDSNNTFLPAVELSEDSYKGDKVAYYGVKEDGTNWTSRDEMLSAKAHSLKYYSTLGAARNAGQVVALMVEYRNGKPVQKRIDTRVRVKNRNQEGLGVFAINTEAWVDSLARTIPSYYTGEGAKPNPHTIPPDKVLSSDSETYQDPKNIEGGWDLYNSRDALHSTFRNTISTWFSPYKLEHGTQVLNGEAKGNSINFNLRVKRRIATKTTVIVQKAGKEADPNQKMRLSYGVQLKLADGQWLPFNTNGILSLENTWFAPESESDNIVYDEESNEFKLKTPNPESKLKKLDSPTDEVEITGPGRYCFYTVNVIGNESDPKQDIQGATFELHSNIYLLDRKVLSHKEITFQGWGRARHILPKIDVSRSGATGFSSYKAKEFVKPDEVVEFQYSTDNSDSIIEKYGVVSVLPYNGENRGSGNKASQNLPAYELDGNKVELVQHFGTKIPDFDVLYTTDQAARTGGVSGGEVVDASSLDLDTIMSDKNSYSFWGATWKKMTPLKDQSEDASLKKTVYSFDPSQGQPTVIVLKGKFEKSEGYVLRVRLKQKGAATAGVAQYVGEASSKAYMGTEDGVPNNKVLKAPSRFSKVVRKVITGTIKKEATGAPTVVSGIKVQLFGKDGKTRVNSIYGGVLPEATTDSKGKYSFHDMAEPVGGSYVVKPVLTGAEYKGKYAEVVSSSEATTADLNGWTPFRLVASTFRNLIASNPISNNIVMKTYDALKKEKMGTQTQTHNLLIKDINKKVEGYIFLDENGNGLKDENETKGIPGATVEIYDGGNKINNNKKGVAYTNVYNTGNGHFSFNYLPEEREGQTAYTVKVNYTPKLNEKFILVDPTNTAATFPDSLYNKQEKVLTFKTFTKLQEENLGEEDQVASFALKRVTKKITGKVVNNEGGKDGATLKLTDGSDTVVQNLENAKFGGSVDTVTTTTKNGIKGSYEFNLPKDTTNGNYKVVLVTGDTTGEQPVYQVNTGEETPTNDKKAPLTGIPSYETLLKTRNKTEQIDVVNFSLKKTEKIVNVFVYMDENGNYVNDADDDGLEPRNLTVTLSYTDSSNQVKTLNPTVAYDKASKKLIFRGIPDTGKKTNSYNINITYKTKAANEYYSVSVDGKPNTRVYEEGTTSNQKMTFTLDGMLTTAELNNTKKYLDSKDVEFAIRRITKKITGTVKKGTTPLNNEELELYEVKADLSKTKIGDSVRTNTAGVYTFTNPKEIPSTSKYEVRLKKKVAANEVTLSTIVTALGRITQKGEDRDVTLESYKEINKSNNKIEEVVELNYDIKEATKTIKVIVFNDKNANGTKESGEGELIGDVEVKVRHNADYDETPDQKIGNGEFIFTNLPEKGNSDYGIRVRYDSKKVNQFFIFNPVGKEKKIKIPVDASHTFAEDQVTLPTYEFLTSRSSENGGNTEEQIVYFGLASAKKKISGRVTDSVRGIEVPVAIYATGTSPLATNILGQAYTTKTKADGTFEFLLPVDALSYKVVIDNDRENNTGEFVVAKLDGKVVTDAEKPRSVANIKLSNYSEILSNPNDENTKKEAFVEFEVVKATKEISGFVYLDDDGDGERSGAKEEKGVDGIALQLANGGQTINAKTINTTTTPNANKTEKAYYDVATGKYEFKELTENNGSLEYTLTVRTAQPAAGEHQFIMTKIDSKGAVPTPAEATEKSVSITMKSFETLKAEGKPDIRQISFGIKKVEKKITGVVTDETGDTVKNLGNVKITVGDKSGTTANGTGKFTITNPTQENEYTITYVTATAKDQKVIAVIGGREVEGKSHSITLPTYESIAKDTTTKTAEIVVNFKVKKVGNEISGYLRGDNGKGVIGSDIVLKNGNDTYSTGDAGNSYDPETGKFTFTNVRKNAKNDYKVEVSKPGKKANEFFLVDGKKADAMPGNPNKVEFGVKYGADGSFTIPNVTLKAVEKKIVVKVMDTNGEMLPEMKVKLQNGTDWVKQGIDKTKTYSEKTGIDGVEKGIITFLNPEDLTGGNKYTVVLDEQLPGREVKYSVANGTLKNGKTAEVPLSSYKEIFAGASSNEVKEILFTVAVPKATKKISGYVEGLKEEDNGKVKVKVTYKKVSEGPDIVLVTEPNEKGYYEFLSDEFEEAKKLGDAFEKKYTVALEKETVFSNQFIQVNDADGTSTEVVLNDLTDIEQAPKKHEHKEVNFKIKTYDRSVVTKVDSKLGGQAQLIVNGSPVTTDVYGNPYGENGLVSTEGGKVRFDNLPDGTNYQIKIVPPAGTVLDSNKFIIKKVGNKLEKVTPNSDGEYLVDAGNFPTYAEMHRDPDGSSPSDSQDGKDNKTETVEFIVGEYRRNVNVTLYFDNDFSGDYSLSDTLMKEATVELYGGETEGAEEEALEAPTYEEGIFRFKNIGAKNHYKIKVTLTSENNQYYKILTFGGVNANDEEKTAVKSFAMTPFENLGLDETVETEDIRILIQNNKPYEVPEMLIHGNVWVEKGTNSVYDPKEDSYYEGAILKLLTGKEEGSASVNGHAKISGFEGNTLTLSNKQIEYIFKNPEEAEKYYVKLDLNGNEYRYLIDVVEGDEEFTMPTYNQIAAGVGGNIKSRNFVLKEIKRIISGTIKVGEEVVPGATVKLKYKGGASVLSPQGTPYEVKTDDNGMFVIDFDLNTSTTEFELEVVSEGKQTMKLDVSGVATFEELKQNGATSNPVVLETISLTKLNRTINGSIFVDKNNNGKKDAEDEAVTKDVQVALKFADGTEIPEYENVTAKDGSFKFVDFADKDGVSDETGYSLEFTKEGDLMDLELVLVGEDGETAFENNQFKLPSFKKMNEDSSLTEEITVIALFKKSSGSDNQGGGSGSGSDNQGGGSSSGSGNQGGGSGSGSDNQGGGSDSGSDNQGGGSTGGGSGSGSGNQGGGSGSGSGNQGGGSGSGSGNQGGGNNQGGGINGTGGDDGRPVVPNTPNQNTNQNAGGNTDNPLLGLVDRENNGANNNANNNATGGNQNNAGVEVPNVEEVDIDDDANPRGDAEIGINVEEDGRIPQGQAGFGQNNQNVASNQTGTGNTLGSGDGQTGGTTGTTGEGTKEIGGKRGSEEKEADAKVLGNADTNAEKKDGANADSKVGSGIALGGTWISNPYLLTGLGVSLLGFFFFILFKRRKKEEDENQQGKN